mgnify:CR=1 FL=1
MLASLVEPIVRADFINGLRKVIAKRISDVAANVGLTAAGAGQISGNCSRRSPLHPFRMVVGHLGHLVCQCNCFLKRVGQ